MNKGNSLKRKAASSRALWIKIIFVVLVVLLGCFAFIFWPGSSILEVEFKADNSADPLGYVEVILGDDKAAIAKVKSNEIDTVRLYHDEMVQMSFSLVVYRSQDFSKITDEYFSQELFPEFANIRIKAVINDQGKIASTSFCKLPCSFD
jgi:flagellar basal body-associated protein FliL